jgi:pyroglutamyl-peptidase
MRVLLYGFGPYKRFRENITATIIRALPRSPGLRKLVLPVRFHRQQFVGALEKHRPDVVLGLGQSSRRRIEIEARAGNRRRASRRNRARAIRPRAPRWLATTLEVKLGREARRSNNAGDYVCNYSMYVMLDHIERGRLPVSFGFVHIPFDYEPRKAGKLIGAALRQITKGLSGKQIKAMRGREPV